MRGIVYGLLFSALIYGGGCMAYKKAYVAIHDSIDEALADGKVSIPGATKAACSCDLSKPRTMPLRYLGDEATVDAALGRGDYPECGGMPAGLRYHLLRPSGQCWSFAPMAESGLIQYGNDKITVKCGQWKGQTYHPVYKSAHDQGLHMPGTKIEPGKEYPLAGETFIYFETRD
jgi:hypothetical protein